jgi:hypothetical protein
VRLALLALAGCGRIGFDAIGDGGNSSSTDTVDGTRLAAYRWRSNDGATIVDSHWFDRLFSEKCMFGSAVDGVVRCRPSDATTIYFADPACTQRAATLLAGCAEPPRHVTSFMQVFELGPQLTTIYQGDTTSCTVASPQAGSTHYALGAQVPETEFVGSHLETIPGSDTDFTMRVADDGARTYVSATQRSNAGDDVELVDGEHAILTPSAEGGTTFPAPQYLDAACSRLAIPQENKSPIQLRFATAPCRTSVYELLPTTIVDMMYMQTPSGCLAIATPNANVQEAVDLAPTSALYTLDVAPGSGRLRPYAYVSPAGDRVPAGMFDTALNTPCVPLDVSGTARSFCVRHIPPYVPETLYSDASCTTSAPAGLSCTMAAPIFVGFTGQTCATHPTVLSQFTTPLATPRYISTPAGCLPYDGSGARLFEGQTVTPDVSGFVELTLSHD